MSENCDAKLQGLETRYAHDTSYCRVSIDATTGSHTGHHVATLRDGRTGWWYGTRRGFVLRNGELFEIGGG